VIAHGSSNVLSPGWYCEGACPRAAAARITSGKNPKISLRMNM
jgi:hypothetical protein